MKQRIEVIVTIPNRNEVGSFKDVFRQLIVVDDSVHYDFQAVLKGLRCLFDESAIISFKCMP